MKEKIKLLFTNKLFLGTFIATLVAIVLGISYAWIHWNSSENTNFTFSLGEVGDAIFVGGNEITASGIGPVLSALEGNYTEFQIVKKSNISFHVTIDFLPTLLPDILKDASFKYILYSKPNETDAYSYVTEGNFLDKEQGLEFSILNTEITMTTYYKLMIYIDGTMENSNRLQGQNFAGKILITYSESVNLDTSGASVPEVPEGMIPVMYKEDHWVKASPSNSNMTYQWYDYDNKIWANAVMVTSDTRETYMSSLIGTEILEDDILAYYVWIPRYKYKLFNVSSTSGTSPQTIEIVFQNKNDTKENGTSNGSWLTHPAFTFDGTELNGIWVGKFEITGDIAIPTIKPSSIPITYQTVSTLFTACQAFGSSSYLTNAGTSQIDSHMIKNTEWGAIAYLKQSKYGLGTTDIALNNYDDSNYLTGCGSEVGTTETSTTCNEYHTTLGKNASTTGNIYGVYDMSGGTEEYVMGVMQDNSATNTPMSGYSSSYNSGYTGVVYESGSYQSYSGISFPSSKYYDLYAFGQQPTVYSTRILGDATGEVLNWYDDYGYFISDFGPWFLRGGSNTREASGGIFFFFYGDGAKSRYCSSRSVFITLAI